MNDALLMDAITHPDHVKQYDTQQLQELSDEIREFLIASISKTGGHIGANLGTIELSVALHAVFHSPREKILFDTGHQGYTHKILTGRKALFESLNQPFGMSRFIIREESEHDIMDATHAGTAISTASGIAYANKLNGDATPAIAVLGDGSLVEGISFEGLNFGMMPGLPLIIVLNDNGMAIAPNVGGVNHMFESANWQERSRAFFEGLGYQYLSVADGHHLPGLIEAFQSARTLVATRPVVVHVKTQKGKGLPFADTHKFKMHFSMAFDAETGTGASPTIAGETYASVASKTLHRLMGENSNIVALTPATPYASNMDAILEDFPDRAFDVGMAEQHAVSMAAGLALQGKTAVVCIQSTFMQRAMDPILHDLCYMKLPVTLLVVRSGFAGFDGPTHHGIYDLSYLQAIPDLQIFYAGTRYDLDAVLAWRLKNPKGPLAILHPYENVRADEETPTGQNQSIEAPEIIGAPAPICIIGVGNCMGTVLSVRDQLVAEGHQVCAVNIRWIKPFPDADILPLIQAARLVITVEENISTGGLGSRVASLMTDNRLNQQVLYRAAIADGFVRFGGKEELSVETGIDATSILKAIRPLLTSI